MTVKKITQYINKNTGEVFEVDEIIAKTEFIEDRFNYNRGCKYFCVFLTFSKK